VKTLSIFAQLTFFVVCCQTAWPQQEKPATDTVAVVGAELRTSGVVGIIPNGIVLIQGDSILGVGDSTLEIPAGAKTIDANGCIITPGLIDARSNVWLASDSANATANDASLNIVDGIDPYSENWHEVLASGVTSVYLQPASKGSLGGYGAVVSVMPKSDGSVSVLLPKAGLQSSLGVAANSNRARQQELERTKKVFDAAIEYRKRWEEYDAYMAKQAKEPTKDPAKEPTPSDKPTVAPPTAPTTGPQYPNSPPPGSRGRFGGRPSGPPEGGMANRPTPPQSETPTKPESETDKSKDKPVKKPDREPAKDDLVRVLKGEIPFRLEVHGPDDVHFAMKLFEGDAFKQVQVVFEGLSDLRSATKIISELKNPLILGPWHELEQGATESDDFAKRWADDFANYDGTVAISSSGKDGRSSKYLRAHAAKAISKGFSQERALNAITIDAAKALGVGDRIGSLAKGKRADLVCFRGEPTNTTSKPIWVMSGGVLSLADLTQTTGVAKLMDQLQNTDKPVELPTPLPSCFALRSSRCWLDGRLQPAVVFVFDGKIKSIDKEDPLTKSEHPLYDLFDAVITPGLISGHVNFSLGSVIDPKEEPDASLVVAADGFAQDAVGQRNLVRTGLLKALLAPGSSNPISGNASLVRIGSKEPIYVREAAAKFVLSESARNPNRFPSSLAGQFQLVSQSLKGALLPSRVYLPASIEQKLLDRRTSNLKDVANGKTVALFEAQTDAEIQSALQIIEKEKLVAMLLGPKQLRNHLDRIQKSKCTIIVQPITSGSYDWYLQDIVQAAKANVPICFAGESAEQLRLTASMLVAAGAGHDQMLASLCEVPNALAAKAETIGKAGLAIDTPADLVIWSGSPLNLGAKPLQVLIDGKVVTKKDH
jgi:imidazolonepropionase-like amidohydrolase